MLRPSSGGLQRWPWLTSFAPTNYPVGFLLEYSWLGSSFGRSFPLTAVGLHRFGRSLVSEDEILFFIASIGLSFFCLPFVLGWLKHRFFFRNNPAAAVPLLAVAAAMGWTTYVLWFHADPSVVGFYQLFYWLLGLAIVLGPGFAATYFYGIRTSIDVHQRRNLPASVVIGAFALATGLIYGGSNWGEADPTSDAEGGWWIPVGFFLAGWLALLVVIGFYLRGERSSLRLRIVQDRNMADARAAASYVLGNAMVLTHAVAGDFWGWLDGLLGVAAVALLAITHELCRRAVPVLITTAESHQSNWMTSRYLESLIYLVIGLGFWILTYCLGFYFAK